MIDASAHRLRTDPKQTLFKAEYEGLVVRDDKIDDFFLQSSTQWDGLSHIGDPCCGFYNGTRDDQITQQEGTRLGVEHFANFGIATRGVLVDLPRHFAATGRRWHVTGSDVATADDVRECLVRQKSPVRAGDILLVRTGWVRAFRDAGDDQERDLLFRGRDYSGLSGQVDMWEFIWDNRLAGIAADNVTVEVWPLTSGRPSLHLGIARMGFLLGEMFDLEMLADDAASTGDNHYFLVSAPLNLRGGVGSPANAMALR